jgi:dethiobiotin synthase
MFRGLFVTGSDTGVGKTVVCAALMHRLRSRAPKIRYWKPFQTGFPPDSDTATVRELGNCRDSEIADVGIRLAAPLAPLFAARLEKKTVTIDDALSMTSFDDGRVLVIEGAGGLLVPINEKEMITDLIARLGMPVVVATRSTLGTINHTLLTLEALRNRKMTVAGVVMVGDPSPDNQEAIEKFGAVTVLGIMPVFETLNAQTLAQWAETKFDVQDSLSEMIR